MPEKHPPTEDFLPLRPVEFDVLLALGDGERHGYAIMQEALRRSDGKLQLEPGTLYRALRRMRQAGLVTEATGRGQDSEDERPALLPPHRAGAARRGRGSAADGGAGADRAHPRPAGQGLR
jgi:hypothetical protein